jgi:hypothetical protein
LRDYEIIFSAVRIAGERSARLWRKNENPKLELKVIEGNPAFSI